MLLAKQQSLRDVYAIYTCFRSEKTHPLGHNCPQTETALVLRDNNEATADKPQCNRILCPDMTGPVLAKRLNFCMGVSYPL